MENETTTAPDRRSVVQVCGLITLGLLGTPVLAACGSDDESSEGSGSGASAGSSAAAGGALAKVADVPVGGALVVNGADGKPVVLVQPTAGDVKAFSAACTHQGTTVAPSGAELKCPSHGSVFGLDGSVKNGPATNPLPAVSVKVDGDNVVAA